jgi:hypothetical protein
METQQSASKPKGKASASLMGVFEADGMYFHCATTVVQTATKKPVQI